ncbi:MAG: DUF4845 domain-containing protein [Pseudomonadota bacterium]
MNKNNQSYSSSVRSVSPPPRRVALSGSIDCHCDGRFGEPPMRCGGHFYRSPARQQGMGMLGILTIAIMVGFFVMSAIRIAPSYTEYLVVKETVIRVAEEYDENRDTPATLRNTIAKYFNTNQIKGISPREVIIKREKGRIVINSNYEKRIPLVWRIDAVVRYDDLEFIAGETYSD